MLLRATPERVSDASCCDSATRPQAIAFQSLLSSRPLSHKPAGIKQYWYFDLCRDKNSVRGLLGGGCQRVNEFT
jgi:hypothetical protein